jgi:recombination protein RecA
VPPKAKKTYTPPANLKSFRQMQEKKYADQLVRQKQKVTLEFISTGVSSLDAALGGGWALGRYHQVIGKPDSCKTAMMITAMVQALEKFPEKGVSYVDIENTVDSDRFLAHGLDPDDPRFFWRKPNSAEEVSDMVREDLRTGLFSMVAVDSVGAMEREDALYDKTAAEYVMGKAAQLLTRMSKQIATISRQTNTAVLQVNQYRKNFEGGMDQAAGPMIMGYMTTASVVMRRMGGVDNVLKIKDGEDEIEVAHKVAARVERSKLVPQGRTVEFWYHKVDSELGETGVDQVMETMDVGIKTKVIYKEKETSNIWFLPDGTKVNGGKQLLARLRAEPDLVEQIRVAAVERLNGEVSEDEVSFARDGDE